MSLGEKIKHFRVRAGLSQPECGRRVGVSAKQWRRWEQGEPPERTIPAIARALGVSVEKLTGKETLAEEDALRVLRAVAATYELTESGLTPQELQHFRSLLAGYVGLVEQAAFGKDPALGERGQATAAVALAEMVRRLTKS